MRKMENSEKYWVDDIQPSSVIDKQKIQLILNIMETNMNNMRTVTFVVPFVVP